MKVVFLSTLIILALTLIKPVNASTFPLDAKKPNIIPESFTDESEKYRIIVRFGYGGLMAPTYLGSKEFDYSAVPVFKVDYLKVPFFFRTIGSLHGIKSLPNKGFFLKPSFSVLGGRDSKEHKYLEGLRNINPSVELGLATGYRIGKFEGYIRVRRVFGGYYGYKGEFGGSLYSRPFDRLNLKLDTFFGFADTGFINTYFGISDSEAAASSVFNNSYSGESGITNANLVIDAEFDITSNQRLHFTTRYTNLLFDVAESPIVRNGNAHQLITRIGTSYKIELDIDHKSTKPPLVNLHNWFRRILR